MLNLRKSREGVTFEVLLQPRSSRNEITGIYRECLKVRVTSPPVEGKANQACIDCIAQTLGLKRGKVEIVSGHTTRRKRVQVSGITLEEFKKRLNHLIE